MDTCRNLVVDRQTGNSLTPNIESCRYDAVARKVDIRFKNGKEYAYNASRIEWLTEPMALDPALCQISAEGRELHRVSAIYVFRGREETYWHICYENGSERDYPESRLSVRKSCLEEADARNVFHYLQRMADEVSLKAEDGTKLLSRQYEKLDSFVDESSVLACYLNPGRLKNTSGMKPTLLFPFGCNASQFQAVQNALEHKLSVIQGPPGTGKTQTILNILANLLAAGKTVLVVSNNNSATANVLEKLSSPQYGLGFLAAPLGNAENKAVFVRSQTGRYPNLSAWKTELPEAEARSAELERQSTALKELFAGQERLAAARQELQALRTEKTYFEQYAAETREESKGIRLRRSLKAKQVMALWQECQSLAEREQKPPFVFKLKCRLFYGIRGKRLFKTELSGLVALFQGLFYRLREKELAEEIQKLEQFLADKKAPELAKTFSEFSMRCLRGTLYRKYGGQRERRVFMEEELRRNCEEVQAEYPIVLSTTFSSRSSLGKQAMYDYLIMDEASQVDIATGALALSCARNAVIVGDRMQLPNVIDADTARRTDAVFHSYHLDENYHFVKKSFLDSVCGLFPDIPQTLLREHYRCHPKIIEFCNQKFYGGNLLIMTEDHGEADVLSVIRTVVGRHERDHMNQRQIDAVVQEVLPGFGYSQREIGVIAPYNKQVEALRKALRGTEIDVATVHKFQGREKDAIILTTVDDEITDFTDDPYLLNVAVSRAKKQLCLVVSGNGQNRDGNIADLISYIEYHNFEVRESRIYSIFDYLYSQYTESRLAYLREHKRVSDYDSENLMYGLIVDTLGELGLKNLGVVCHFPLRMLLRDLSLLDEEEARYVMNSATHTDFLIYNKVSKQPVLTIEVDGFCFHREGTRQYERDRRKDRILCRYDIPLLRFATNGSGEKERLTEKLRELCGDAGKKQPGDLLHG